MSNKKEEVPVKESKQFGKVVDLIGYDKAREYLSMDDTALKDDLAAAEVEVARVTTGYKDSEEYLEAVDIIKVFNKALAQSLKSTNTVNDLVILMLADTQDVTETKQFKKAKKLIGDKDMVEFMGRSKQELESLVIKNLLHKLDLTNQRDANSQYASAVNIKKDLNAAIKEDTKNAKAIIALTTLILGKQK